MVQYSPVLICIDLGPHSRQTLQFGLNIALLRNTAAAVLHVVHEYPQDSSIFQACHAGKIQLPLKEAAEKMLDLQLQQLPSRDGISQTLVIPGIPQTRITEIAEQLDACCIVMADNPHSSLAKVWRGSVVDSVKHLSEREILLAPVGSTTQTSSSATIAARGFNANLKPVG